ncbi:hypothetical protein R1flu_007268 [Riccia fluitans]|uniref:Diphosphomevalonate decarboxylase n=1 Tax=Riccia fluitans TaxID=41844 RepID=A0ABD1YZH9_9MARC
MGIGGNDWVLMKTARAPSNIAVIKYWGKRDEKLILPINSSISVTLDYLFATTTVAVSPSFTSNRLWLNGKEVSMESERYKNCLQQIRSRATDVVDEKTGLVVKKEAWKDLYVHVSSRNNFPTAAGLASSAAGFACLVYALAHLMGAKETYEGEFSAIARLGSGSACRSLYGGFVKWNMGKEDSGSDSIATQIVEKDHWKDLVIIIAVVSSRQKETSSTAGMQTSVKTSPLLHHRAKAIVPKRIEQMEEAILNRDFPAFSKLTCADSNQFHATCLDTSPPIFYMNDTSRRLIGLVEKWNAQEGTPQAAYTFDAGPNAVLFAPNNEVAKSLLQRILYLFPPAADADISKYVIGDQSIMELAGIKTTQDIESLPTPIEWSGFDVPRTKGELGYLICSRPGQGAVVLDESAHLLDGATGFPA